MARYFVQVVFVQLLLFHAFLPAALIDLEEGIQDFVLETRQLAIPGYPQAFNPSIVRWQGSLLLSFRDIPDPKTPFVCHIGFAWMDEEFHVVGTPQILNLRAADAVSPSRAEDARLIVVGDRLFIVYDDNVDAVISRGGFRVYLAELLVEGSEIRAVNVEGLFQFEGESSNLREKAWVPFDYEGNLLLAYSLNPHKIFLPVLGSGSCRTIATTHPQISWTWGEMRGGTSGMLIDSDCYLAFFHSSTRMMTVHSSGKEIMHYFIGAYTYSSRPPFTMKAMSPEPIVGENFYNGPVYKPYWKPLRAVFPCGYISDERHIWVFYGKDDYELWMVKLDKQGLLDSLVPVCTPEIAHLE